MLSIRVRFRECCEFGRVLWRYKGNTTFIGSYCFLSLLYLFSSPYTISRRYLKWHNADDVYTYGETPLTVLSGIMDKAGVGKGNHVFELGSGSGYTSLWLHRVAGCKVTAIELIPGFVRRLQWTVRLFGLRGIEVRGGDFMEGGFEGASVVYLYASNLDEAVIRQLVVRLSELPEGTKIITVSYPLQPYACGHVFDILSSFQADFPWGSAEVIVQQVA